ncbi:MAG: hypothetical protein ACW98K_04960 [Candidatus Kariarchaeaceae archaeon]
MNKLVNILTLRNRQLARTTDYSKLGISLIITGTLALFGYVLYRVSQIDLSDLNFY